MHGVTKAIDRGGKYLEYVAAVNLAAITIIVLIQIFFRYIMLSPLTWPEEVIRLLFVWLSFVGATIVFRSGGHFRLNFTTKMFSKKTARKIRLSLDFIMLSFTVLFFYYSIVILKMAFNINYVSIDLSVGWSYIVMPISTILMIPYIVIDMIDNYRDEK